VKWRDIAVIQDPWVPDVICSLSGLLRQIACEDWQTRQNLRFDVVIFWLNG